MRSIFLSLAILILTSFTEKPSLVEKEICFSSEEQLLYDMIMQYRQSKNLPSIPPSSKLSQVAKAHAFDLAHNYDFDPSNKCNPHSWSKKGNWSSCCYTSDHKEAACMWDKPKEIAGYPGRGYEIAYYSSDHATAKEGLDGWKVSSGHNPLLVNSGIWSQVKWNAIGLAIYKEYGIVWFGEEADSVTVGLCE